MTRPGLFLCGCDPLTKRNYNVAQRLDGTVSGQRHDPEGYEVCPEHGKRLYGWASPSLQHPGGQHLIDWGRMGSSRPLRYQVSDVVDRRNIPIEQAKVALATRAQSSNGVHS